MTGSPNDVGTHTWVERTGGLLTGAERRGLLRPLASAHVTNAVGRLSMIVGVNTGRRARVAAGWLRRPDSVADPRRRSRGTSEADARRCSTTPTGPSPSAAALGALEGLAVDTELLFAAALLHDTGLPTPAIRTSTSPATALTHRSGRRRGGRPVRSRHRDGGHGHHAALQPQSPPLTHGPVAYLLAAGAGVDVAGVRSWQLPPDLLAEVVEQHPRLGFKREFAAAFRAEAARVPRGRVAVPAPLRRLRPRHQARALPRLSDASSAPLRALTRAPSAGKPGHSAGATSRSRAQAQLVPPVRPAARLLEARAS